MGNFSLTIKWNRFYSSFSEALIDCGKQLTKQGEYVMRSGCKKWLTQLDSEWPRSAQITRIGWGTTYTKRFGGDRLHPWYSGTLHDSISIRVADGNRIIATEYMPQGATGIQTATAEEAGKDYNRIVGWQFGRLMAGRAAHVKQSGTNAQMFIGVPYAQHVNEQPAHEGFIDELQYQFVSYLKDYFDLNDGRFKNLTIKPRV